MKRFNISKEKKNNMLKKVKREHFWTFFLGYGGCILLPIVVAAGLLYFAAKEGMFVSFELQQFISDGGGLLLIFFLLFISIAIGISRVTWTYVGEKYLQLYGKTFKNEELAVYEDKIVYAYTNTWERHATVRYPYHEIEFKINDIQRIEYDREHEWFLIVGFSSSYTWNNQEKGKCLDKSKAGKYRQLHHLFENMGKHYDTYFSTIVPDLFENNEELKKILTEKFGELYVEKNRKIEDLNQEFAEGSKVYLDLQRQNKI